MPSTAFVQTDGKLTAQSYHPCHIFGDGNIYGVGVRYSFYINYAAGIIALWYGVREDITSSRFVLTAIAFALWAALLTNSTGDSLVILDWSISLLLIAFLPLYSIWRPIFHGTVYILTWMDKVELEIENETDKELAEESKKITEQYKALTEKRLELDRFERQSKRYDRAFKDYREAVHSFVQTAQYQDQGYSTMTPPELQRIYIEKMSQFYSQKAKTDENRDVLARRKEQNMRKLAQLQKQEYATTAMRREHKKNWRHEKVAISVVFAIWTGYVCAMPWLYFKAIDNGRRQGCDVKLRVIPVYAAVSIYNGSFRGYLRFSACAAMVLGAASLAFAVYLFVTGCAFRLNLGKFRENKNRHPKVAGETENEHLKNTNKQNEPPKDMKDKRNESSKDTVDGHQKKDDAITTIPKPKDDDYQEASEKVFLELEFWRIIVYRGLGVPACVTSLVTTAALVEETVKSNNIDLSQSPLSETSQLLAFIISLMSLLNVLFHAWEHHRKRDSTVKENMANFIGQLREKWRGADTGDKKTGRKGAEGKGRTKEVQGNNESQQETPKELTGRQQANRESLAEQGRAGPSNYTSRLSEQL